MRARNFVIGAVLGALTGTTITLALAPVSGEELRAQIKMEIERIRHEVRTASTERRAELEAQLDNLRQPRSAA